MLEIHYQLHILKICKIWPASIKGMNKMFVVPSHRRTMERKVDAFGLIELETFLSGFFLLKMKSFVALAFITKEIVTK